MLLFSHQVAVDAFAIPWMVDYKEIHGTSQARLLEWVARFFSRGSYSLRKRTCVSCIGRQILYHWVTRETLLFSYCVCLCLVAQSCLTLWDRILQARILPFPPPGHFTTQGSSPGLPHIVGRFFTNWATREAPFSY